MSKAAITFALLVAALRVFPPRLHSRRVEANGAAVGKPPGYTGHGGAGAAVGKPPVTPATMALERALANLP